MRKTLFDEGICYNVDKSGRDTMLTNEEQEFVISCLPFWDDLSKQDQHALIQEISKKEYESGKAMHQGSQDCNGLFLVKTGQLRVYMMSKDAREITLYQLLERDICLFSASCMFKNISFDVYVEAQVESVVYQIPVRRYEDLNQRYASVMNYTSELMASRFSDAMWVMEQVLFSSMDTRLAAFLLEEAQLEESDTLSITHDKIARHLGSAREVISRMLKYFKQLGYVDIKRGHIVLLNKHELEVIADA